MNFRLLSTLVAVLAIADVSAASSSYKCSLKITEQVPVKKVVFNEPNYRNDLKLSDLSSSQIISVENYVPVQQQSFLPAAECGHGFSIGRPSEFGCTSVVKHEPITFVMTLPDCSSGEYCLITTSNVSGGRDAIGINVKNSSTLVTEYARYSSDNNKNLNVALGGRVYGAMNDARYEELSKNMALTINLAVGDLKLNDSQIIAQKSPIFIMSKDLDFGDTSKPGSAHNISSVLDCRLQK